MNPFNSGPVSLQRNPPINPQYYNPSRFVITSISEGVTTIITTETPHDYVIGQQIKLLIPVWYGAYSLNTQTAFVIEIPSITQVTVNINSIGAYPFGLTSPSPQYPQHPQIIAIGDINSGTINSFETKNTGTYIPGAFINISPN